MSGKETLARRPTLAITEQDVVYGCKVLDALAEAFDRVAAQPQLAPQLVLEIMQKTPEILDAFLAITQPECRPIVYDLAKSCLNAVKACLPKKKQ